MTPFRIITLDPQDWPRYRALRLEALSESPQAYSSTYADMITRPESFWRGRLEEAQAGEHTWLLFSEEDGRLTGIMGAFREPDEPAVAHVVSVYVTPEKRGTGAAGALLEALLETVRSTGTFRVARLGVNPEQARALALYRRAGFRKVGEETGRMGDGLDHVEWIMDKDLDDYDRTGLEENA